MTGRNEILQVLQLLRGKRASKFRQSMAVLLERYIDADMGLADDITDMALDAHMANLEARKEQQAAGSTQEVHRRIESRDTTKALAEAIKSAGAAGNFYGLMNGGVNRAVTGMPNLADGSTANAQLQFMQDQCAKAAELLGLHKKAKDVQTREYITGNKSVMSDDLAAQKRARLAVAASSRLITA